jgi:paraquat-inducible protein A
MRQQTLITCHECGLLQRLERLPKGASALCGRCGALLHRHRPNSLDRTLAWTLAGAILFAVANSFPFLRFELSGQIAQTTLISGVRDLYHQGFWGLAGLVLLTSILIPLIQISMLLYILIPLKLDRVPWHMARVFRLLRSLEPWGMMEVFMLGILVSIVKLASMATIIPGIALWAFGALIFVLAAAMAALDPDIVWDRAVFR